eukprot:21371-Heterococcus_DN1.PRE.1
MGTLAALSAANTAHSRNMLALELCSHADGCGTRAQQQLVVSAVVVAVAVLLLIGLTLIAVNAISCGSANIVSCYDRNSST